jgi:hypothetical protein
VTDYIWVGSLPKVGFFFLFGISLRFGELLHRFSVE